MGGPAEEGAHGRGHQLSGAIDRVARARRSAVEVRAIDPEACLDLGNGRFAITVDVTGLQTLPASYPLPDRYGEGTGTLLGTMAEWGWHARPPEPEEALGLASTLREYSTARGPVPYVDLAGSLSATTTSGLTPTERYLRANPHRLDLGRLGLTVAGRTVAAADLEAIEQRLEVAEGAVTSRFRLGGRRVEVRSAVHPERDAVGVVVRAEVGEPLGLSLAFGAGSEAWGGAAPAHPRPHTALLGPDGLVARLVDGTRYAVRVSGDVDVVQREPHLVVATGSASGFSAVVEFLPPGREAAPLDAEGVLRAAASSWAAFWASGAVVETAGTDAAAELQRRTVLSEYLTRVHSAGGTPPVETGLTVNSWWGRSHLEMHWWHSAHFAMWGRPELLEPSLDWYSSIAPVARATARLQGLPGARWPKQVGPDGAETPSDIGPFLVWQQPHPIELAELVRRARPADPTVLERYADLVLETAACMAAMVEATPDGFSLPPPLVPAQESYAADRATMRDPAFELASWGRALRVAARWREDLGLPDAGWARIADAMRRPLVRDGVLEAVGVPPFTVRTDHPSMLGALGVVPDGPLVDAADAGRTLDAVLADWDWPTAWGWDFPMAAMTATRVGRPDAAVAALLRAEAKNRYLPNGHDFQDPSLPRYLPGNGGTLAAVALMAAGSDARPGPAFPASWSVRAEGFRPLP